MPHADPVAAKVWRVAYNERTRKKRNARMRAWKAANSEKVRAYAREAYQRDPEKYKAKHRRWAQKHKPWLTEKHKIKMRSYLYDISHDAYVALWEQQEHRCAGCLCGITLTGRSSGAVVDHCHESNSVRGLLCRKCNLALGHANDNAETLRRLATYLETAHG